MKCQLNTENIFEDVVNRYLPEVIMFYLNQFRCPFQLAKWLICLSMLLFASAYATTDLAPAPLSTSTASVVHPNILLTLDDSGSMDWDYVPDYAGGRSNLNSIQNHCKGASGSGTSPGNCSKGMTPFQVNIYNGMAYDPTIFYSLPIKADSTYYPSQVSPWTAVKVDGYGVQSTGSINMLSGFPEVVWCSGTTCKKDGVDTNNPFAYRASVSADNPPEYALPGSLAATGTSPPTSTLLDTTLNQVVTNAPATLYNGNSPLDVTVTGFAQSKLTGTVTISRVGTSSVVNVSYNTPTSPALVSGDLVAVAGAGCGTGFISGTVVGNKITNSTTKAITVLNASSFTYTSTSGTKWTGASSCTAYVYKATHTAVAPMISKTGNTVTVELSSAPSPALSATNLITVSNGTGTGGCDAGYQLTTASTVTIVSTTSFSYTVATPVGTASSTSCLVTQSTVTTPSAPSISLSGTMVTVTTASAHGLSTGNLIQVVNGSTGTCTSGFLTNGSVSVTKVSNTKFTYSNPQGSNTSSATCKIYIMPALLTAYTSESTVNSNPYYFVIIPTEYCDSIYLTNCKAATGPVTVGGINFNQPAYVRFCTTDAIAALPPGDSGAQTSASGTVQCQGKYSFATTPTFMSARYGLFWRGDIVPATTTYGNENYTGTSNAGGGLMLTYNNALVVDRSKRADCVANLPLIGNCTYAEEMTNFSNWYAYYHTRIQMMKSAAGQAFSSLDSTYRVGFTTINPSSSKWVPVGDFTGAQRTNWYTKFYAINPSPSTPLREALSYAGRYFAGMKPTPATGVMTDDPVQYACQLNYSLVTTDGFWNGTDANVKELNGTTTMRNYDNVDAGASARKFGAYDGNVADATTGKFATDTLADVAMYYYKTDLRTSALGNCSGALNLSPSTGVVEWGVCADVVPMTSADTAAGLTGTQHMTTFTLGLSDGLLTYQPDYATASSGDFYKIKTAATGCSFSGSGTCNWPLPAQDSSTALDDLWHAAVNGRGQFYQARDPLSLAKGLTGALTQINVQTGAAAASATSSPNITPSNNSIFSSTYRTGYWDGEVIAQLIDTLTGDVITTNSYINPVTGASQNYLWSAQAQLDALVAADSTADILSRQIWTYDTSVSTGNPVKSFLYANLSTTEKSYFDNHCAFALLSQCTPASLTAAQITTGNIGNNLVEWLRGNQSLEAQGIFRTRQHILGDTVNAKPAYVQAPLYSFNDAVTPDYSAFVTAHKSRQGVLYMGANDGMLHAFNSTSGAELWAYMPKIVMPNLFLLAGADYANNHQYFVDGSPETMDIYVDSITAAANSLSSGGVLGAAGWHTILVGGLGLGGRGFYALDITDPYNPVALWEFCSDSTVCPAVGGITFSDTNMGYSYGNPVITKRSSDGKWVVLLSSGYDNGSALPPNAPNFASMTNPGNGQGILYVLDAVSGAVLNSDTVSGLPGTSTHSGTSALPSGLAKLSPWVDSLASNNETRYVYGGDLNGDIWRFDLGAPGSTGNPTVTRIATLMDGTGTAAATQSVTTRVELGDPLNDTPNSLTGTGNPVIYAATGRYLGYTDVTNTQLQTVYAIKDDLSKSCGSGITTCDLAYIGNPRSPNPGFCSSCSFVQQTIAQPTGTTRTTSHNPVSFSSGQGWYADLEIGTTLTGERVNIDPLLVLGSLIVISNIPQTTTACIPAGTSWLYSFDYRTGQNLTTEGNTVVGQSLGNALSVGAVFVTLPSGSHRLIDTLSTGTKLTVTPTTSGNAPTTRMSWRELMQ
jgi:type IV pilus assembly protein PilY1